MTTTTETALKARISAFAAWADKAIPGWRGKIDTDRLDMKTSYFDSSSCGCIGAQLDPQLSTGIFTGAGFYINFKTHHQLSEEQCIAFCLNDEPPTFWSEEWENGTVDQLWIEEISREDAQGHGQD